MKADFPTERWFWFDPPFHPGPVGAAAPAAGQRLAHRPPARLGRRSRGREEARARHPAHARRAGRRHGRSSSNGSSVYTFQCRRLERFVHGRVIFAGDARARRVAVRRARRAMAASRTPTICAWKLAAVLKGKAPRGLLDDLRRGARARAPTRTSSTPPARPTSSRRRTASSMRCGMPR